MAIITYDKDELVEYVPKSQRGEENPTVIVMKHLSFAETEKYARMVTDSTNIRPGKQVDMEKLSALTRSIQKKQFIDNVVEVRNYSVRKAGRLVPITTGAELYEVMDNALMAEVLGAMESAEKLSEGQAKNSEQASGISSVAEQKK